MRRLMFLNEKIDGIISIKPYKIIDEKIKSSEYYDEMCECNVDIEYIEYTIIDEYGKDLTIVWDNTHSYWDNTDVKAILFPSDKDVIDYLIEHYGLQL